MNSLEVVREQSLGCIYFLQIYCVCRDMMDAALIFGCLSPVARAAAWPCQKLWIH